MVRPLLVRAEGEEPLPCGLYADELEKLARYNGERSRGLLHDPEWAEAMAQLQERFDAAQPGAGSAGSPSAAPPVLILPPPRRRRRWL